MHASHHAPHVLVIDHTPEIQFLFHELLAGEPWRSTILAECPPTIDEIARLKPDLIVHDYVPTSADVDLASMKRIAADPRTMHLPLILCSATPTLEDVTTAIRSPNLRVVTKPFAIEDMLAAIQQRLETRIPGRHIAEQPGTELSDSM